MRTMSKTTSDPFLRQSFSVQIVHRNSNEAPVSILTANYNIRLGTVRSNPISWQASDMRDTSELYSR